MKIEVKIIQANMCIMTLFLYSENFQIYANTQYNPHLLRVQWESGLNFKGH